MKSRLLFVISLFLIIILPLPAQNDSVQVLCNSGVNEAQTNKKGEAIIQVFMNFHSHFGENDNGNNFTKRNHGFELERVYVGYQYEIGKGFSIKGVLDMGAENGEYDRMVYVKNALACYKNSWFAVNFGLISTTQFNTMEKQWGYRYIYKSFQDRYKFGSSADLGVSVAFKPLKWLAVDAIVVNGEGYKKMQKYDGLAYGLGASVMPVDGLTMRVYGSLNQHDNDSCSNIYNYSAFVGYNHKYFSFGGEWNGMYNYCGVLNQNMMGLSLFAKGRIKSVYEIFARYDYVMSNWSDGCNEHVVIAGAQFKLGKYVKLAPNFRCTVPTGAKPDYSGYVSCYFGL